MNGFKFQKSDIYNWCKGILSFLAVTALYTLVFAPFYHHVSGNITPALSFLPVIVAGWFMGKIGGISAALLCTILNMWLLTSVGRPALDVLTRQWHGVVILAVSGFAFGRLSDLFKKLEVQTLQLVQAEKEKLSSIVQLAGGVAHEINNPLTGVLNNIQLIKMEMEKKKGINPDDLQKIIDAVEKSALRCVKITRSLLDFSRPSKVPFQPVLVNEVIEKMLTLMEYELTSENIIIKKKLDTTLPLVRGNSQHLEQVMVDIILNARWSIRQKGDGGTITVKTKYERKKDGVGIYISDTGIGIPKENIDKIFDPFFTTKSPGEGTGLGLSIAYNIIKEHKGTIEVESQPDKGATFKISLPKERS